MANAYDAEIDGIRYNFSGNDAEVTSGGRYAGSVVIPETVTYNGKTYTVTSIGNKAFYQCSGLTSITFPNSLTSIGDWAFHGCSGLITISIPNSVTSIGNGAFASCRRLTSISIPNSVTSIGEYAFYNCSGLTSITIPNSVTSIGGEAFAWCSRLTTIDSYINEPFVFGDWAFSGINEEAVLIVPQGTRDAYLAKGWTEDVFCGGVVERTGISSDYATIYCPESDLTIPDGIQAFTGVVQGEWLILNEVTGKIPAGTAVVLKGQEGTYTFAYTTGAEPVGENDLKGTADPLVADGTQYILAKRESYGFFKETPGTTIPARKAYLETTDQNVKGFLFHEDDATSINEELRMKNEESEADIYNLDGQRVNKAQKGIYIINGKKVLR